MLSVQGYRCLTMPHAVCIHLPSSIFPIPMGLLLMPTVPPSSPWASSLDLILVSPSLWALILMTGVEGRHEEARVEGENKGREEDEVRGE